MRNTLFSFINRAGGAVFTFGLTLFLVRALGPTKYGVLVLAISVGAVVMMAADFGTASSASRFTAERPRDRVRAAAVLRTALGMQLVSSTLAAVVIVLLAPVIADAYGIPELTLPLRLVAIAVAAQGIGGLFLAWFVALHRNSLGVRYALFESSVETSASVSLVILGGGAAGAAAGRAIGFVSAGILAVALAVRLVGWPAFRQARERPFPLRRIARYGAALLVVSGVWAAFSRADVLIIAAYLGSAPAGIFDAAFRVIILLQYPGLAVGSGFAPRLAKGQRSETESARFVGALRYTMLFSLLIAAPLVVWADPIVRLLLGDEYSEAAEVMRALAPTVVLAGISPALAAAANYLGEARRRIPLAIGALVVNVVIDILLVPRIGIVAGAIGTGAAYVLYTGGHVRICQQALGVSFSRLTPTAVRGTLASGAAALVLFVFGTSQLSVFAWIAGPPLATLAYLGALVLLRELDRDEVQTAIRHPGRLLQGGSERGTPSATPPPRT